MSEPVAMAICYDFDDTLAPGNIQEYNFFPALGIRPEEFWHESNEISRVQNADPILGYMQHMVEAAKAKKVCIRREDFRAFGRNITLFPGVAEWFGRVNAYAAEHNVRIEHYVLSSGIKEMLESTPIAPYLTRIFASSFMYDEYDVAMWPAMAVNFTTKTQFLFRINKGTMDLNDNEKINAYLPDVKRYIPFSRMVYIGDGTTDIPCMRLVKDKGGISIAVYSDHAMDDLFCKNNDFGLRMMREGRVDFVSKVDYSPSGMMDTIIKTFIRKVSVEAELLALRPDLKTL